MLAPTPDTAVFAIAGAVFVASLLGSMHCAGMCGAFLLFAVGGDGGATSTRENARLQAAYHFGRLTTYALLGAFAGGVGGALDLGGQLMGVQRVAALLAGTLMVVFGLLAIARARGVKLKHARLPKWYQNLISRGQRAALALPPVRRALLIGLLTTMLPCGWLWMFAVVAAGTASPAYGALVMAVFWAGTLPVLITLGTGIQALAGPLRRHLPTVTSLLVLGVGVWTLLGRVTMPQIGTADLPSVQQTGLSADAVHGAAEDVPPCCAETSE